MQFYQRLRDVREDADKTQTEIASLLGTRQQQYARWESGAWQMPIEHYKTLARFYNISIDYLAGLVDTPYMRHEVARKRHENAECGSVVGVAEQRNHA